jgi:hypothetical protein
MNRLFGVGAFVLSLATGSALLQAQDYQRFERESRPYRADLFEHVQFDLDRAAHNAYPNGRIDHAFHELGEFRARYNAGRPARRELDSAIAAIRDLAGSNVLRPRDRDALQNDVVSMRRFREDYRGRVY